MLRKLGALLRPQGEQIGVVAAVADQRMALGQRQLGLKRRVQRNEGLVHQMLGERLDVAVAGHSFVHRALAGGVDQATWVSPRQAHDAP